MLEDARAVLARKGRLTSALLDVAPGVASARQYIERFGSLGVLYELIGYEPSSRQRLTIMRGVGGRRPPPRIRSLLPFGRAMGKGGGGVNPAGLPPVRRRRRSARCR